MDSAREVGRQPRARLRALGLRPRKGLSQSFLESEAIADAIIAAAELDSHTEVLEVGPGLGVLTRRLATRARRVVAVELDAGLAAELDTHRPANVELVSADILTLDPTRLFDTGFVVVANLPYHITSPVLRHLLASGPPFAERLIVMVQAEVAERIAAPPGQLSALAVSIQSQATVEIVLRVPSSAFYPRPKVDSAVLRLTPFASKERRVSRGEHEHFVKLVQAGFKQPRKTLLNSLADGLAVDRAAAASLLNSAVLDGALRPQALTLDDWVRLFRAVTDQGPRPQ